jgi:hypothetical protein
MSDRTEFQKEWIDGPALELAMLPVEVRCEKIIELGVEIEEWIAREFPNLTQDQVLGATRSYTFDIIQRALEIAKASSGAVGRA